MLTVAALAGCGDGAGPGVDLPAIGQDAASDAGDDAPPAPDSAFVDTARTRPDAMTPNGETLRPNEGTTGKPCVDDATCDPAHTGENVCTAHHFSALGTLYPSPMCVGRECEPGPLGARPLSCDGDHGICVGDGALVGSCLPRCSFDPTSPARGCPRGTLCTPSWVERDASGTVHGEGWCAPACTTDAECFGGDHCLVDEGLCIGIPITRTFVIGVRCDAYANPPEVECNCMHDQGTGVGMCTARCTVGDPKTACPDGFLCTTAVTRVLFSAEPTGVAAHCLPTCTSDGDCSVYAGRCAEGPTGKTCVPGRPPP